MTAFFSLISVSGLILAVSVEVLSDVTRMRQDIAKLQSMKEGEIEENLKLIREIDDLHLEFKNQENELFEVFEATNNTVTERLGRIKYVESTKLELLECIGDFEVELKSCARKQEKLDFAIESLNQELSFWKFRKDGGFIAKCVSLSENEQPIGNLEARMRTLDDWPDVIQLDLRIAQTELHSVQEVHKDLVAKLIMKRAKFSEWRNEIVTMIEESAHWVRGQSGLLNQLEREIKELAAQRETLHQKVVVKKNEYEQKVNELNDLKLEFIEYISAQECYTSLLTDIQ